MRRLALILFILAFVCSTIYAGQTVDFFIESEYKNDTIDYNETESTFYREKISVFFSRESLFNLSYIYLPYTETSKYTWNLSLRDISPNLSVLLGNYFVNFGTGLLIGRKNQYEPDIFSTMSLREKNTFSACKSGNPIYAFNGIAGMSYFRTKYMEISLNIFYSLQERFISQDSYDSGQIPSSLNSIDSNLEKINADNELIEIHTKGIMISVIFMKLIILQTYGIMTDLRSIYKGEINWDYDEAYNESRSVSRLSGYGAMLKYKDNFLSFVMDYTITRKELLINDREKKMEYGFGSLYGLEFDHPFLLLSASYKLVKSTFYSPYSSSVGDEYPESAWFFNAGIKPYSNLKIISGLSSQKRNLPSSRNQEPPVTNKENLTMLYTYGQLKKFQIDLRRREKTDDENDKKIQLKSTIHFAISDYLLFKLSGLYQTNEPYDRSYLFHTGFDINIKRNIRISPNYLTAKISGDNIIYASVSPVRNSSIRGFFIRQDSGFIILKSDINIVNLHFSCRYAYQYSGDESVSKRLEFYASGYF